MTKTCPKALCYPPLSKRGSCSVSFESCLVFAFYFSRGGFTCLLWFNQVRHSIKDDYITSDIFLINHIWTENPLSYKFAKKGNRPGMKFGKRIREFELVKPWQMKLSRENLLLPNQETSLTTPASSEFVKIKRNYISNYATSSHIGCHRVRYKLGTLCCKIKLRDKLGLKCNTHVWMNFTFSIVI